MKPFSGKNLSPIEQAHCYPSVNKIFIDEKTAMVQTKHSNEKGKRYLAAAICC